MVIETIPMTFPEDESFAWVWRRAPQSRCFARLALVRFGEKVLGRVFHQ
jgi:hypothetical protein